MKRENTIAHTPLKVIISGGGTGGHIYPAVSIANALKQRCPDADILFVGAEGRMEMEKVPAAGYPIVGLPVAGLQRRLTFSNLLLPFKLWKSLQKAKKVIREFRPDVVVGVGGYASGPVLWSAQRMGIPTLIQEQNSYAGVTNKLLSAKARKICVAYEGMDRFFPADRVILTGNPIRQDLRRDDGSLRAEAAAFFGLDPAKKTILVVGGSLGARTLNQTMTNALPALLKGEVQWLWQTGKGYYTTAKALVAEPSPVKVLEFIYRMDYAFALADVVVSRAGAGTISELCVVAKPCIFVPSPNVSEDHQTKNARALVNKQAALMVQDAEAPLSLINEALQLANDDVRLQSLRNNIAALAKPNAAVDIVGILLSLVSGPCASPSPAPSHVYFIGIGGIGMSALARYYKHQGAVVAGYDRTPSPLTEALEGEGIIVHYEDGLALAPEAFIHHKENVLVIYTPAVPADHSELQYFRQNGYEVIKRSAALGHLAASKTTLAVAGTHGKTTTTTLLSHLLTVSTDGCSAFLGGISKNYNSNLLLSQAPALVAEADEYDRSFLQLFPQIAVITAADPDHLDIYGTPEAMQQAFVDFAAQVKPGGVLIVKEGVNLPFVLSGGQKLYRYSYDRPADFYAGNIRLRHDGLHCFDLHYPDGVLKDCVLGIPGWVNIENAVAASAAAWAYGADMEKLSTALESFAGVRRRFDVQVNRQGCTYIDDYAHHPEELRAAITSIRETYPGRKITGVFQPHLYSRTRDFADGFAESLSLLDRLILLDIYPARELPVAGVSSEIIFDKVTQTNKQLCRKEELMDLLAKEDTDVLVTFGAGDIDRFVPQIKTLLETQITK